MINPHKTFFAITSGKKESSISIFIIFIKKKENVLEEWEAHWWRANSNSDSVPMCYRRGVGPWADPVSLSVWWLTTNARESILFPPPHTGRSEKTEPFSD